jgi:hypothetical protein
LALLSEVVIGSVEPLYVFVPRISELGCKFTNFPQIIGVNGQKN